MSKGKKLGFSFVLRCAWPVFGMGVLLSVQAPVQAAPSAYVTNQCASSSSCNNGTVSVFDTATGQVTGSPIPVGRGPLGVAVSPDGSQVYVANNGSGTVSVIDTASNQVPATIPVGAHPFGVAVSPDGSQVSVCGQ